MISNVAVPFLIVTNSDHVEGEEVALEGPEGPPTEDDQEPHHHVSEDHVTQEPGL